MSQLPRVALVGRPNVGKSTLFNRLIGRRQAVVADIPGTTRDRLEQIVDKAGVSFILTDMAGLEPTLANDNEITRQAQAQVRTALHEAQVIVWVVDAGQGLHPTDYQVAALLRDQHKPVLVAANKADNPSRDLNQYEFSGFGFDEVVAVSALHARGIDQFYTALLSLLPAVVPETEAVNNLGEDDRELRVSIVGRPNVGKSTLLNRLVGEERSVVSAEAGTTRDSVDTVLPAEQIFQRTFTKWQDIRLIDTAGIRRAGKIGQEIEAWSVVRTYDAIDAAEVVLLLIDAQDGLVHQDLQVAEQVVKAGRALVIVINKWDQILAKKGILPTTKEDQAAQEQFLEGMRAQVPFLHWVSLLFLSAQDGLNTEYLGRVILRAYNAWDLKVDPDLLVEVTRLLQRLPRLKNLMSLHYDHGRPPVFRVKIEGRSLPHFSTRRLVENELRATLDIGPTLIKLWFEPSVARRK